MMKRMTDTFGISSPPSHWVEEHDKRFQPPHLEKEATKNSHRPRQDESLIDQNDALRKFIERTEKELNKEQKEGRHNRWNKEESCTQRGESNCYRTKYRESLLIFVTSLHLAGCIGYLLFISRFVCCKSITFVHTYPAGGEPAESSNISNGLRKLAFSWKYAAINSCDSYSYLF